MKNILLIGGSTGIGYELSQKLKQDNNIFISTRNQNKFNHPNIKTNELDLDKEFETELVNFESFFKTISGYTQYEYYSKTEIEFGVLDKLNSIGLLW